MASKGYLVEAARAASLANHAGASLLAAAGNCREAARLLRAAEALSRAAVSQLLAPSSSSPPRSEPRTAQEAGTGAAEPTRKKKKPKKKSTKHEAKGMDVDDKNENGEAPSTLAVLPSAPSSAPCATSGEGERAPPGAAGHDARHSPQATRGTSSQSAYGSEFDQEQLEAFCFNTLKMQAKAVVQSDGCVEILWTMTTMKERVPSIVRDRIKGSFPWIKELSLRVVKKLPKAPGGD